MLQRLANALGAMHADIVAGHADDERKTAPAICSSFCIVLRVQSARRSAVPSHRDAIGYDDFTEGPSLSLGMTSPRSRHDPR